VVGGPLEGYNNLADGCDGMVCEQTTKFKDWLLPIKKDWTVEQEKEDGPFSSFKVAMFS
jgi:hypothetical protein